MAFDRRTYLTAIGLASAGTIGLAGCLGDSEDSDGSTGTLLTSVTDQPGDIGDFDSCVVTIVGTWLGPSVPEDSSPTGDDGNGTAGNGTAGNGTDASGAGGEGTDSDASQAEREYYEFDEPQEADLVDLQGETVQLVDERELPTAQYQFLQLDTAGIEATLQDGSATAVETPGQAPLTFNKPFGIRADTRTSFTADFTPVKRGQTGSYLLQPVARGITVEYEGDT